MHKRWLAHRLDATVQAAIHPEDNLPEHLKQLLLGEQLNQSDGKSNCVDLTDEAWHEEYEHLQCLIKHIFESKDGTKHII